MIEQDTVKLLRECDAGVRMGTSSIEDVLPYVRDEKLREHLETCLGEHRQLGSEIEKELERFHDEGKQPNPLAQKSAQAMTKAKLVLTGSDKTIADMMTDGCDMGVKSLNKYLNEYGAAEERAKDIAKKLIMQEKRLADGVMGYL